VKPAELMQAFVELANEAGLEVRIADADGDFGQPTTSGVCRLRDAIWVVLSQTDSVEVQLDVLAAALRDHAVELLEERYLPPAVRQRLFESDRPHRPDRPD